MKERGGVKFVQFAELLGIKRGSRRTQVAGEDETDPWTCYRDNMIHTTWCIHTVYRHKLLTINGSEYDVSVSKCSGHENIW